MEQQPTNPADGSEPSGSAEIVLSALTEELQQLRQNIISALLLDIERLQAEKTNLSADIQRLQSEKEQLLQQRQTTQQQVWARQLAQVLATHLSEQFQEQLGQIKASSPDETKVSIEETYRLLASLDTSLNTIFQSLQQELNNYHSQLSQQLAGMSSLEEQGEATKQVLMERLQAGVAEITKEDVEALKQSTSPPPPSSSSSLVARSHRWLSRRGVALTLIILSVLALAIYKVAIRVIFHGTGDAGLWQWQSLLTPTFGNALFVLFLRMLVVVILMLVVAPLLHPRVWIDLQALLFAQGRTRTMAKTGNRLLQLAVASGGCLFLSQLLIYIAIGQMPAGIAATLFFIYPILTMLLSWLLFNIRPNLFRVGVIGGICLGSVLVLGSSTNSSNGDIILGSTAAITSGISFAFYVILTQMCDRKLHPVPFSMVNFATMLLLCFFGLMLPLPQASSLQINSSHWSGIIIAGIFLGVLTVIAYVLNNLGIGRTGTAKAGIISASDPVFTSIVAWAIVPESLSIGQFFGVLIVTLAVAGLSWEKMQKQQKC